MWEQASPMPLGDIENYKENPRYKKQAQLTSKTNFYMYFKI